MSQSLAESYLAMLRIRLVEEKVIQAGAAGLISGSTHLCIGQEAIPVGACSVLRADDPLIATYRGHGWALARGHARSGRRIAIAAYMGAGDRFDQGIADFAVAYADQTERDYVALAGGALELRLLRAHVGQLAHDHLGLVRGDRPGNALPYARAAQPRTRPARPR